MASQLDADIVSVMLFPVGKVALAAPAQQSSRMRTSDFERSRSVWIADHLEAINIGVIQDEYTILTVTRKSLALVS